MDTRRRRRFIAMPRIEDAIALFPSRGMGPHLNRIRSALRNPACRRASIRPFSQLALMQQGLLDITRPLLTCKLKRLSTRGATKLSLPLGAGQLPSTLR